MRERGLDSTTWLYIYRPHVGCGFLLNSRAKVTETHTQALTVLTPSPLSTNKDGQNMSSLIFFSSFYPLSRVEGEEQHASSYKNRAFTAALPLVPETASKLCFL